MQIGLVGLGRMGAGISKRLRGAGHQVVGFDADSEVSANLSNEGLETALSLAELIEKLTPPRVVWLMVPSGTTVDDTMDRIAGDLGSDGILIDGGNSNYRDTLRRNAALRDRGITLLDVGTSGGVWGNTHGYCLTIGGPPEAVDRLRPLFETLAPEPDRGWGRVGGSGAGHFVKMIHNGIEYGLMQAYAEGFAILKQKKDFDLDLSEIAGIWNGGSVIRSWLLELAGRALRADAELANVASQVEDSGEGRWAAAEAVDLDVAAPIITLSLIARLQSRDPAAFSNKFLAALRHEFGGHKFSPED